MDEIEIFLDKLESWVWGAPLLLLLLGTGVYLTFLLRGVQFRYLGYAFKQIVAPARQKAEGDISHFEALMTTLAGAIGTGSIVGVATAITLGGLGALFWMWVTALLGMATKYAESLLAVKYRDVDARGEMIGGPMEYMEKGLGWKWMAVLFAALGTTATIGVGNLVQVNSIAEAAHTVWLVNPWVTGLILAVLTGVVILGGIRSIGHVSGVLVPVMALFYLFGGVSIVILHIDRVPEAFGLIFSSAFQGQAAAGGFAGATIMMAMQAGVSRSVFSNEAGMGISSIAAAAAKTDSPGRQAMITMTGALFSTIIVCTITGLAIAVTGALGKTTGAGMAIEAFGSSITGGAYIVTIGLILFAFSTMIAWAYYGEKCCEYLFGERSVIIYRVLFIVIVIPAAVIKMEVAWNVANITNGLMVIPNLIALIALSKVVTEETKVFIQTELKK